MDEGRDGHVLEADVEEEGEEEETEVKEKDR